MRRCPKIETRRPRVAPLIETSNAYARSLLAGVTAYLAAPPVVDLPLGARARRLGAGMALAVRAGTGSWCIENRAVADAVRGCRLPTVDLSAARLLPGVPCVETDDAAIAELAMAHLLSRGYRHVAYCGLNEYAWSLQRCEQFGRLAAAAGRERGPPVGPPRRGAAEWAADQRDLVRWVASLPKPVGVMACFDIRGRQLLDACRVSGVRVPDDVAVIGVDDDAVLCELSDPPLSSVILDGPRTGYRAAQMLEAMMSGQRLRRTSAGSCPEASRVGVRPMRWPSPMPTSPRPSASSESGRARGSTWTTCCAKSRSRGACWNRDSAAQLGRTPHAEILRCRIDRAKDLLAATDLPLKNIARATGIAHAEYLSVVFKRSTGRSPLQYRKEQRRGSALCAEALFAGWPACSGTAVPSGKGR